MFTAEQRDQVRQRVLALAQTDPRVIAGALTGSMAFGGGDRWSDIDVAFGIAEGIPPEAVLEDWTQVLAREWGVLHHWDLHYASSVYRVFLWALSHFSPQNVLLRTLSLTVQLASIIR